MNQTSQNESIDLQVIGGNEPERNKLTAVPARNSTRRSKDPARK